MLISMKSENIQPKEGVVTCHLEPFPLQQELENEIEWSCSAKAHKQVSWMDHKEKSLSQ